ncbi:ABC transporter permease [Sphingomonas zeae]
MRYRLHLLVALADLAVKRAMQYRLDFLLEGLLSLVVTAVQLVPVLVLFGQREAVAGWSLPAMLVLLGWFMVVRALLEGVISPGLVTAVGGIRTGQFDYVLMRPVGSLFLCSFGDMRPWKLVDLLVGGIVIAIGLHRLGQMLSPTAVLTATVLAAAGLMTLHALYVLSVAGSFALVRIQSLSHLLSSFIDFGRWPIQVFQGAWALIFTFILPLAVITSHPARALLNEAGWTESAISIGVAAFFTLVSHRIWAGAVRTYRSASS